MKKLLTVSLVAMMAVTTARAEIASKAYVDQQDGQLSSLQTTAKNNLVAAINEVKGTADAALPASSVTSDYSATGTAPVTGTAVAAAIAGALSSGGESVFAPADVLDSLDLQEVTGVIKAVSQTDGQVAATAGTIVNADVAANAAIDDSKINATGSVASGNTGLVTGGDVYTAVQGATSAATTAIENLDAAANVATTGDGNVVTEVSETDGIVAAVKGATAILKTDTINENGTYVLTSTRSGDATNGYTYTYQWENITRATPAQQGE